METLPSMAKPTRAVHTVFVYLRLKSTFPINVNLCIKLGNISGEMWTEFEMF